MELAADTGGLECQGRRRFLNATAYIGIRRDAAGTNGNPRHTKHGGVWAGMRGRISRYSLETTCEGCSRRPDTQRRRFGGGGNKRGSADN